MAHFCGFIKLIFLLLMLARIPSYETRPLKRNSQTNSDLIAGNEFLKLFMEHDQLDKDFKSSELTGGDGSHVTVEKRRGVSTALKQEEAFDKKSAETGRRFTNGRSLKDKGPKLNQAEGQMEDSKQVVKLVTSGSKIVFLEDYDENDAILDAEARDIDLKKEIFPQKNHANLDDYKVVAVSVSSSSQRGTTTARNRLANTPITNRNEKSRITTTTSKPFVTMTPKPPTVTTTVRAQTSASSTKVDNTAGDNFINRSHKSEFSIEEVEPLTMTQQQSRKLHSRHRTYPLTSVSDTLEALDSENSASTNIHNVLAAPLQSSASARSTSMVTTTFHSGQRNMTINHDSSLHASVNRHKTTTTNNNNEHTASDDLQQQQQAMMAGNSDGVVEDQLLPFQTVIYHDTKAGHGPQSRSISYSSISQNVEDLKKWQQTGILAEARRNVSESLKPMPRSNTSLANHQPEPAKFYSQPSKMYSEPSKFYSEPAKVYSEPAKVYGEPEKFYSEPAKVYGQPSKFYSEPAKVYSQPAKVYSEPAKTYWPILTATTTSTPTPSTITPLAIAPAITTTTPTPLAVNIHQSSRKPAIVSRIAFGEAHLISSTTSTTTSTTTTSPLTTTSRTYGSHGQHQYSRTYSNHRNPSSSTSLNNENSSLSSSSASASASSSSTPSRRILFNLDRLPYDLLNAPEPTNQQQAQHQQPLELEKNKRPQQTLTYQSQQQQQLQQEQLLHQQQQQQQKQRHNINPCLESAVSSLFSSSTLSTHSTLLKQRQQHSNQNAKGLPNGDLVKCVAEISHTSSAVAATGEEAGSGVGAFTTERSHVEDLFTPTPEQNYEIEESVSVMTNGRVHNTDVHSGGGGGKNSLAQTTTSPVQQLQHNGFKPNRQRTRVHFGTNVNDNPTDIHDGGHRQNHHLTQTKYNTNSNVNADISNNNNHRQHHTATDYQQYDDGNDEGEDDSGYEGDAAKNNDYDDDGSPANHSKGNDDDSKVAYIVEGQNYRKYRVEEETDDGFIVGEYGVVNHNDGNLRGVRYTADSTINRSLIQKALLTFLKLK